MNTQQEVTSPSSVDPADMPLGIRHLLLLTACTAVAFSTYEWLVDTSTQTLVMRILGFAYCLIYGGALTGLCIFITRSWLGIETLRHPGHLLLVFAGFGAALDGLVELFIQLSVHFCFSDIEHVNGYELRHVTFLFHQLIGYGLITLISAWLLRVFLWMRRWTIGFVALWVTFFTQFVTHGIAIIVIYGWLPHSVLEMYIPEHCMLIGSWTCVFAFSFAVIRDWQLEIRRDWLHWCGLAAAGLLAGMEWVRYVRICIRGFL